MNKSVADEFPNLSIGSPLIKIYVIVYITLIRKARIIQDENIQNVNITFGDFFSSNYFLYKQFSLTGLIGCVNANDTVTV